MANADVWGFRAVEFLLPPTYSVMIQIFFGLTAKHIYVLPWKSYIITLHTLPQMRNKTYLILCALYMGGIFVALPAYSPWQMYVEYFAPAPLNQEKASNPSSINKIVEFQCDRMFFSGVAVSRGTDDEILGFLSDEDIAKYMFCEDTDQVYYIKTDYDFQADGPFSGRGQARPLSVWDAKDLFYVVTKNIGEGGAQEFLERLYPLEIELLTAKDLALLALGHFLLLALFLVSAWLIYRYLRCVTMLPWRSRLWAWGILGFAFLLLPGASVVSLLAQSSNKSPDVLKESWEEHKKEILDVITHTDISPEVESHMASFALRRDLLLAGSKTVPAASCNFKEVSRKGESEVLFYYVCLELPDNAPCWKLSKEQMDRFSELLFHTNQFCGADDPEIWKYMRGSKIKRVFPPLDEERREIIQDNRLHLSRVRSCHHIEQIADNVVFLVDGYGEGCSLVLGEKGYIVDITLP